MPDEKFETPRILSDLPLVQGETARFHFDKFAITLSRLIASKTTRTPLTIGVSGAWGSGKTTLLRRIKEMLDATSNIKGGTKPDNLKFVTADEFAADEFRMCKTVWFDVWKYSGEDQILSALLRVIVEEMRRDGFWNKMKVELAGPKKDELKWLDMFTNALTTFVSAGTYTLNLGDFRVDTPLKEASAFFDYFDVSFKRLLAAWVGGKLAGETEIKEAEGVLVVFIDDLDRCLPKKIIEVLEAVKLFLDKTGCVFVLGAHTDIIREAVKKHYIDEGLKEQDAADYLDKFLQLRFDLPPAPEEEMESYVRQLADGGTLAEHWRLVTIGAGYNPRKVKVFLNDLSLRWAIWKNVWQAGQVEYEDFVRWEVWMASAPKFRLRVHQVYDKNDLSILTNLVDAAFRWAGGEEEARAGFKEDVTDSMRRVLREILSYKERFAPEVLDSLLHLTSLPAKPELTKSEPSEVKLAQETISGLEEMAEKESVVYYREKPSRVVEKTTPSDDSCRTIGGIEFIKIPAGKFLMGSKDANPMADSEEKPQQTLELPDYWMAKFPITNNRFAEFIQSSHYLTAADKEGGWSSKELRFVKGINWEHPLNLKSSLREKEDYPVVQVSWLDAMAYCKWFNEQYKKDLQEYHLTLHLPTEAQWEKAARGEYGNEWPWGNEFDSAKCNSREGGKGSITPVDTYPLGESPYGVADMIGNVWEWTHTLWKEYPYKAGDGRENENGIGSRIFRGGSFHDFHRRLARCACRLSLNPDNRSYDLGFRVCVSPIST